MLKAAALLISTLFGHSCSSLVGIEGQQYDYTRCNQFFNGRLWHLAAQCYRQGLDTAPQKDPAIYLNLIGVAYHEMRRPDEAKEHYQKAIELAPNVALYHFNLAMAVMLEPAGLPEALPSFKEAIRLDPQNPKFPFTLANLCYNAKELKMAEEYYTKGLELQLDNNAAMWNMLGVTRFELRRYRAAVGAYRLAVVQDRTNPIYSWNLGNALYNIRKAERPLLEEAAHHMMIALDAYPTNAEYAYSVGNAFFQLQQYENATRFYDLGLKLSNHTNPIYNNLKAVAAVNELNIRIAEKDHIHSTIDPNTGRYTVTRDHSYFTDLTALKEVENHYEMAVKLNRHDGIYYFNLGNLAFGQDDLRKAREWYEKAIKVEPNNAEFHSALGSCLMEMEEEELAVAEFNLAIGLDPTNVMHYFNKGRCLFKLERYFEAAQAFELAAQIEPNNANIQNWWGTALVQHGYNDAAAPMFNRAAAMDQHQHLYHLFMDGMLYSMGAEFRPPPNYTSPIL